MLKHYFNLALRNLLKRKAYAFINIVGLSAGFAVCLLIWKYVDFELSYDNFHKDAESIYRATFTEYGKNLHDDWFDHFGFGVGPALAAELPEVSSVVRVHPLYGDRALISYPDANGELQVFAEENVLFVDSSFLNVFNFPFSSGNPATALHGPGSMVLTASMVEKYFGPNADPIGKVVHLSTLDWGKRDYTITGVIRKVPENTSIRFDFLLSMHDLLQLEYYREPGADWTALDFVTFIKLRDGVDPQAIALKTKKFMDNHTGTEPAGVKLSYQPLRQINLSTDLNEPNDHLRSLYFLVLISLFILSIAFINFVNLSTAQAGERAKEVGIRKAIGVSRMELITQFMLESAALNFAGVVCALLVAAALMPLLSSLTGKSIGMDFADGRMWLGLAALFAGGSCISGFYPSFILTSFRTADALKDKAGRWGKGLWLRNVLVVFQFSASLLLIIGTFVIYRQMKYMRESDKGLSMDKMLIVNGPQILGEEEHAERMVSFKNELRSLPFVKSVATSGKIPGGGINFVAGVQIAGREKENEFREPINVVWVDTDFIQTYGMKLISGSTWDPRTDYHKSVLINEAAVSKFGLGTPEQALAQRIRINGSEPFAIRGVIRNFHWNSLRSPYMPMLFRPQEVNYNLFSIQLTGNTQQALVQIERLYKHHFGGNPFVYRYLEDFFDAQYKQEQQFEKLFGAFSALAVVIACLGLIGLAAFTTTQRRKEIGIRKVMGATVQSLIGLLSSNFIRLLLLAALVTLPFAWYSVEQWLDKFAFRTAFTAELYLLPVLSLTVICMATTSVVIIRGSRVNAAEVLRTE